LLGTPQEGTLVYCCGPEGLLSAVEAKCARWPSGSLHLERFSAKPQEISDVLDESFELVLQQTGVSVTVPPDISVFQAALDAGANVLGSCMEGICGTCETEVVEGDVDHRDSVLNEEERAANEFMMSRISASIRRRGTTYPVNTWYVIATKDEVSRQPLARRALETPVVLYRTQD